MRRTAASAPKLSVSLRQRGAPGRRLAEKPLLRSAVVKRKECLSCRVGILGGHGLSRRHGQVEPGRIPEPSSSFSSGAVTIGTFSTAASIALGTFPPVWLTRPYLRVFADLRPLAVEGAVPTTAVFAEVDVTFGDDISGVGGSAGIRLGW